MRILLLTPLLAALFDPVVPSAGSSAPASLAPTLQDPAPEEELFADLRAILDAARAAQAAGDLARARELVASAAEDAVRALAEDDSVTLSNLCYELGTIANDFALERRAAERIRRAVLEQRERTLSEDHPGVLAARANLAVTLRDLGDLHGARVLLEAVLVSFERTLPEDHPSLLTSRQMLATTLHKLGDYQGARVLLEALLAAQERTLPENHLDLLRARLSLGTTLSSLGDLQGARALQEAVLAAYERTLPEDHPSLLEARGSLALTIAGLGDYQGARKLIEEVLAGYERTLPEDHPNLIVTRGNLAAMLFNLGDFQGAREVFEEVLAVRERTLPDDHTSLLTARNNLAATQFQLGDYEGARVLQEAVLVGYERTLPEDNPLLLQARGNLAKTVLALRDPQGARVLLEAAVAGYERTHPEDHPGLLDVRRTLAMAMGDLGDLQGARVLLEAVLAARERTLPEDHLQRLVERANLASIIRRLGDLEGARALGDAVLAAYERTLPEDHPFLLAAQDGLAETLRLLGDYEGARVLWATVLAVRERTLPEGHPARLLLRGNLAVAMGGLGDLQGARVLLEAMLAEFERTLPADDSSLLNARTNVAVFRARGAVAGHGGEGDWSGALDMAGEAVRGTARRVRASLLGSSSREAEERVAQSTEHILNLSLSFALGGGQFGVSEELAAEAFGLSESGRGAGLAAARIARAARGSVEYAALREEARAASAELAMLAQRGGSAEAFHAARTRREGAERELMRLAQELLGDGFAGFDVDVPALTARLADGKGLVAFRRYTRFWLEEVEGGPETEEPEVKQRSRQSLGAFVLARSDDEVEPRLAFVDLGSVEAIDASVRDWRAVVGVGTSGQVRSGSSEPSGPRGIGIDDVAPTSSGAAEARALRRLVWDPLAPALGTAEQVSVALDDVLHLVPLEALHLEEEDLLLGERWRIETRTSFWELLAEDPPVEPTGVLVALGDVAYGAKPETWSEHDEEEDAAPAPQLIAQAGGYASVLRGSPSEGGFASLAHTGTEVRSIAALLRDSAGPAGRALVLEGPLASLASLEALAPKTRWLHLATHGWFAPDRIRSFADRDAGADSSQMGLALRTGAEETAGGMSPLLLCGLALAGSNLAPDFLGRVPGLLTAEELSGLDLTNCELAVLSACDTNVGVLSRAGQGVASLQKALHMAGARSVITSLWKVDDAATAKFFERFYTRLWHEALPKSEALWRTKLELRAEGHPPRDWAAWVLTGDPD